MLGDRRAKAPSTSRTVISGVDLQRTKGCMIRSTCSQQGGMREDTDKKTGTMFRRAPSNMERRCESNEAG
ncbi:hypothetical protein VZT92_006823 [Zoarces viviparus]|uniref:Uncharacterized protein n=1 Tax=Zoarces viviparus TaxID=48416 RepID=A0AAW1FRG0_ZOAVI